ncbi:TPA: hypothetical protein DDZ10_03560 [Candidatus Uhrbacteria bacterium]|uniref:Biotin carboxylase-like protein n=1 Tax=Candidatus Uhrbacteria bacterium GW2011_GWC2_53_7 TaxID=1618986 RepID=A0A0G1XUE1_9BACT|nr:MAG: Biotin carboxylase-like protein [Parcubacteria group bacterium GW2011_GWA2_53_21]KKW34555.1 MAG: Biotin carboxylase-like protein [Candidatus Uhrbacteria bacterium GW2011_GWC2_53_7]OGL71373.1 MAG: hypothetical protein A3D69_03680 [Candidatus Uhrbacteria bacterium RIFCSPHIGHO2_02_FULL_54_11]HBL39718.1 hypothetical protein [Candidatus Uhrbacteria bacterium]
MKKIEFNEEFFFVHPHGLYLEGAQMALPGLRFIVDRPGLNSTAALLQDARTQAELPAGARLLLMKPAPKIEFLAREHGWRLVSVSSELNRRFENKLTIGTGFAQANLPSLQFEVSRPKDLSWEDVLERLGTKLVVQTERGHAGSGSYLIDSEDEWKRLVVGQGDYETKLMPFVEGETWTLNACVTHYGTLVSRPFLQLQNLPWCGADNPLTTCGNWHKEIEDGLAFEIMKHAERFGDEMHRASYRGWFGLDVLVQGEEIKGFIECNPRLTASTGIFTRLQVEAGQTPLLTLHVLELLGCDYELDLLLEQEKLNQGFEEYHIVLRNGSAEPIVCPEPEPQAGVEMISRKPGTPIPPGEPYALAVAKQPFSLSPTH